MSSVLDKKCYRNDADFVHGVMVKKGPKNEPYAIPLDPGRTVWLDDEEVTMTARAPQEEKDNPFLKGLNAVSDAADAPADRWTPLSDRPNPNAPAEEQAAETEPEDEKVPEITGTEPAPAGDSAIGERSAAEIVGTPEAEAKPEPPKAPEPKPAPPKSTLPPGFGQ